MLQCLCAGIMASAHVLWGGCCRAPPSKTPRRDCRVCSKGGGRPHALLASLSKLLLPVQRTWSFAFFRRWALAAMDCRAFSTSGLDRTLTLVGWIALIAPLESTLSVCFTGDGSDTSTIAVSSFKCYDVRRLL